MAQKTKSALGRGLESLLPSDFDRSLLLSPEDRVQKISISELSPNPFQPRQHFDEAALAELAASIKRHGIVQPLVITPDGKGSYHIIAGERRFRAARQAKLETVPAIVRTTKDLERIELALIENVQRVDLNPLDQALSIEKLHEQFNLSYQAIADQLGKAASTISNLVRLLLLPAAAKTALNQGQISEGHARTILALGSDKKRQEYLLNLIINQGWSVRQAERFVSSVKAGVKDNQTATARTETESPETKDLSQRLKTPVKLRRTAKGGRLEIYFKSDPELARIISLLS